MGTRSGAKRERWKKYPGGIKTYLRDQRLLTQKRNRRIEWLYSLALLGVVALLAWREHGAIAGWVAIVVLVGLGLEFALFLALLSFTWSLILKHPRRDLLRYIVLTGMAAALLHATNPAAMSVVPRYAALMAGVVFTVMKLFRKSI